MRHRNNNGLPHHPAGWLAMTEQCSMIYIPGVQAVASAPFSILTLRTRNMTLPQPSQRKPILKVLTFAMSSVGATVTVKRYTPSYGTAVKRSSLLSQMFPIPQAP